MRLQGWCAGRLQLGIAYRQPKERWRIDRSDVDLKMEKLRLLKRDFGAIDVETFKYQVSCSFHTQECLQKSRHRFKVSANAELSSGGLLGSH